jgi:hypothetical protein
LITDDEFAVGQENAYLNSAVLPSHLRNFHIKSRGLGFFLLVRGVSITLTKEEVIDIVNMSILLEYDDMIILTIQSLPRRCHPSKRSHPSHQEAQPQSPFDVSVTQIIEEGIDKVY